jgi:hypothetical protein
MYDATRDLEESLRQFAESGDAPGVMHTRLKLAAHALEVGNLDRARQHAELAIEAALALGDHTAHLEAGLLLAGFAVDFDDHDRKLVALEPVAQAIESGHVIRLHRGLSRARTGRPVDAFLLDLVEHLAGRTAAGAQSDVLAAAWVHEHPTTFTPELLMLALEWSRRRDDLLLTARILVQLGQRAEACEQLRRLAGHPSPGVRHEAAALLLAALPADAHAERRRWCDEVEARIGDGPETAALHFDLALALLVSAEDDPVRVERAWSHAEASARQSPDEHIRTLAIDLCWRIRGEQLQFNARASTPLQAERAAWLVAAALPSHEADAYLCNAALALLQPGPLVHPACLDQVQPLLARLHAPSGAAAHLWQRLAWIRSVQSGTGPALAFSGPPAALDAAPAWLVALAAGHEVPAVDRPIDTVALALTARALEARPDRSDAMLDWLTARDDVSDIQSLYQLVELAGRGPTAIDTARYVERMAERSPPRRFAELRERFEALQASNPPDLTAAQRTVDELLSAARSPAERVEALFHQGVLAMKTAKPGHDGSSMTFARQQLAQAAELAREHELAELLFAVLVSQGNAWRRDDRDLDQALARYVEADRVGTPHPQQQATLWKVWADALLARRSPGDAALALAHLERALQIRDHGWLRAATSMSLADAELAQTSGDELTRHRRALTRLEDALHHSNAGLRRAIGERTLTVATKLLRMHPDDVQARAAISRVEAAVPELATQARSMREGAAHNLDAEEQQQVLALSRNPAYLLYVKMTTPMHPERIDPRMLAGFGVTAEQRAALLHDLQQKLPDHTALLATVAALDQRRDPAERPGAMLAQAEILAHLAGRGMDTAARARELAEQAEPLIEAMTDPIARAALLLHLASLWAPVDHAEHPVRDFTRSATIARGVLDAAPEGSTVQSEATGFLARATRYRSDGDRLQFIQQAASLYETKLRLCERRGDRFGAEQAIVNLEEARSALGIGGEDFNLERSIERITKVVAGQESINPTHLTAQARDLTIWGYRHRGAEADRALAAGQQAFDLLFARFPDLDPGPREDAENYRCLGRAAQATRRGDWAAAIGLWRRRLAAGDRRAQPTRWAIAAHNLADTMVRARRDHTELLEAIRLCEETVALRRVEDEPVHLWETQHLLGDAVHACLTLADPEDRGDVPDDGVRLALWHQGCASLAGAMQVARELGGGERLFRTGFVLALLARIARTPEFVEETAERAWRAMDEARPFLLHHEDYAVRESAVLLEIAVLLAQMTAGPRPTQPAPGCAFVLAGTAAQRVSRWLLGAVGCAQRRLNARWRRPPTVSQPAWSAWIAAVQAEDPLRIAPALTAVRTAAPDFLSGQPALAGLEAWLQTQPGSAAIILQPTSRGHLAAIYQYTDVLDCRIVALTATSPATVSESDLAAVEADMAPPVYDETVAWARRDLIAPLQAVLGRSVHRLLWCAPGLVRALSPHDLWPNVAVTAASDLALHAAPAPAPTTTAIVVADPGPDSPGGLPGSIEAGAQLARGAKQTDLRVRLGRGAVHGRALGVECPGLIDAPPEPEGVLQDLIECKQIVLLCHGSTTSPDTAALELLDRHGEPAQLDLRRIAGDPRSFAGATVLLLACETGRAGPAMHRAGGFPGMLLACGARRVIAPLWTVFMGPATDLAQVVLRALADARSPAAELAVQVGRLRAATPGTDDWLRFHTSRAFVVWDA